MPSPEKIIVPEFHERDFLKLREKAAQSAEDYIRSSYATCIETEVRAQIGSFFGNEHSDTIAQGTSIEYMLGCAVGDTSTYEDELVRWKQLLEIYRRTQIEGSAEAFLEQMNVSDQIQNLNTLEEWNDELLQGTKEKMIDDLTRIAQEVDEDFIVAQKEKEQEQQHIDHGEVLSNFVYEVEKISRRLDALVTIDEYVGDRSSAYGTAIADIQKKLSNVIVHKETDFNKRLQAFNQVLPLLEGLGGGLLEDIKVSLEEAREKKDTQGVTACEQGIDALAYVHNVRMQIANISADPDHSEQLYHERTLRDEKLLEQAGDVAYIRTLHAERMMKESIEEYAQAMLNPNISERKRLELVRNFLLTFKEKNTSAQDVEAVYNSFVRGTVKNNDIASLDDAISIARAEYTSEMDPEKEYILLMQQIGNLKHSKNARPLAVISAFSLLMSFGMRGDISIHTPVDHAPSASMSEYLSEIPQQFAFTYQPELHASIENAYHSIETLFSSRTLTYEQKELYAGDILQALDLDHINLQNPRQIQGVIDHVNDVINRIYTEVHAAGNDGGSEEDHTTHTELLKKYSVSVSPLHIVLEQGHDVTRETLAETFEHIQLNIDRLEQVFLFDPAEYDDLFDTYMQHPEMVDRFHDHMRSLYVTVDAYKHYDDNGEMLVQNLVRIETMFTRQISLIKTLRDMRIVHGESMCMADLAEHFTDTRNNLREMLDRRKRTEKTADGKNRLRPGEEPMTWMRLRGTKEYADFKVFFTTQQAHFLEALRDSEAYNRMEQKLNRELLTDKLLDFLEHHKGETLEFNEIEREMASVMVSEESDSYSGYAVVFGTLKSAMDKMGITYTSGARGIKKLLAYIRGSETADAGAQGDFVYVNNKRVVRKFSDKFQVAPSNETSQFLSWKESKQGKILELKLTPSLLDLIKKEIEKSNGLEKSSSWLNTEVWNLILASEAFNADNPGMSEVAQQLTPEMYLHPKTQDLLRRQEGGARVYLPSFDKILQWLTQNERELVAPVYIPGTNPEDIFAVTTLANMISKAKETGQDMQVPIFVDMYEAVLQDIYEKKHGVREETPRWNLQAAAADIASNNVASTRS